jgi:hypothetical protein
MLPEIEAYILGVFSMLPEIEAYILGVVSMFLEHCRRRRITWRGRWSWAPTQPTNGVTSACASFQLRRISGQAF